LKKTICLTSLTIALTVCTLFQYRSISKNIDPLAETNHEATGYLKALPSNLVVPPVLPATIKDPEILAAWIYLYNQQVPFQLWDGSTLNGRKLAQFILGNRINVTWGTKEICNGISCAPRDGKNKAYPIYISASLKDQPDGGIITLAETLAHEIFHHTEPFGNVGDTKFEEYWAFFVGEKVAQTTWIDFQGYDSLNPVCLKNWFTDHHMQYYLDLDPYPKVVSESVKSTAQGCVLGFSINE